MKINWSEKNLHELQLFFSTDAKNGHSKKSYAAAREQYGANRIRASILEKHGFYGVTPKRYSLPAIIAHSLDIMSIIYLLISVFFSVLKIDTFLPVIFPVMLFAALFTFFMTGRSERKYIEIFNKSRPKTLVIREGARKYVPLEKIVPGDVLMLSQGDIVPADARIISCNAFFVLTPGNRSGAVRLEKTDEIILPEKNSANNTHPENSANNTHSRPQANMTYACDIVAEGNAVAIVTATGGRVRVMRSSHGNMNGGAQGAATNMEKESSTLQTETVALSRNFNLISIFLAIIFMFGGIIQKRDLTFVLLTSLSLCVSSFAEQLPVVADYTVTGIMARLSKMGILIKSPLTIDKLNKIDTFITHKNDTFTDETMSMKKIHVDHWDYEIRTENLTKIAPILSYAALCSIVSTAKKHPQRSEHTVFGNESRARGTAAYDGAPVDVAVYDALARCGLDIQALNSVYMRLEKVHFDERTGIKYTLARKGDRFFFVCFGEAENILAHSSRRKSGESFIEFDTRFYNSYKYKIDDLYKSGDIVMAVATKEYRYTNIQDDGSVINDLDLYGFICFSQPKSRSLLENVTYLKKSGLELIMTVDAVNNSTKKAAQKFGIIEDANDSIESLVIDNGKIARMTEGMFYATADKYKLTLPLSQNNKLMFLKALRFRMKTPACTLAELGDLPLAHEAELTFTSKTAETGILTNRADGILRNMGMNSFVRTIKGAVLAAKNIFAARSFFISLFLAQNLFVLFATLMGGAYIFGVPQIMWAGLLLGFPLCMSISLGEENTHWYSRRRNLEYYRQRVIGKGFIGALFIFVPVLFSYFMALFTEFAGNIPAGERRFGAVFADTFVQYSKTGIYNPLKADEGNLLHGIFTSASSAAFITLFFAVLFSAVFAVKTKDFTDAKLFKNKYLVFAFVMNAVLLALVLTVPSIGAAFGFSPVQPITALLAVICGFMPVTVKNMFSRE